MPSKTHKKKVVKTWDDLHTLASHCEATGYCAFDFETSGKPLHSIDFWPTMVSISFQPHSSWVVPLKHTESPFQRDWLKVLRYLSGSIFQNPNIVKVCWNAKYEHMVLLRYHCNIYGVLLDGMLAKHLLDENTHNDLKSNVARIFPEFTGYDDDIKDLVNTHGWANVPLKPLAKYNALDSDLTLRLTLYLERRLIKHKLYRLFRNLSMMNSRNLAESELMGLPVDAVYLDGLRDKYNRLIQEKEEQLQNNPVVRRFVKSKQTDVTRKAVESLQAEIANLRNSDRPQKDRMIAFRMEKIRDIHNGNIPAKQRFEQVNFSSVPQLKELFYEHPKGFRWKPLEYGDSGQPSTSESSLLKLMKQPKLGESSINLLNTLIEYRGLSKLYSTYIVGMQETLSTDSRVHTTYFIHGTVTGRLSSRNPNMQNIPRPTTNPDIKKMFVPPKGFLCLELDYSQAELRIVAEVAKDAAMIKIFEEGYNIHTATGLNMEGRLDEYGLANAARKDPEHPRHLEFIKVHKKGKVTNFSILYGQSDLMTAEALGVSPREAAKFKADWFKAFPGVTRWIKQQQKKVLAEGFVTNIFGRKRRLYDSLVGLDKHPGFRTNFERAKIEEAKRQAVNAPIQGGAAGFTDNAAITIRTHRQTGSIPGYLYQNYTVHDSIGFFIKPEDIHTWVPKLVEICASAETEKYFGFRMKKVKMAVSAEVGISWGELEAYNPQIDYTELLKQTKHG